MTKMVFVFLFMIWSTCSATEDTQLKASTYEKREVDPSFNTTDKMECPDGHLCPNGNTCCVYSDGIHDHYGCCKFPNAVCCRFGLNCCPQGYTCGALSDLCVIKQAEIDIGGK